MPLDDLPDDVETEAGAADPPVRGTAAREGLEEIFLLLWGDAESLIADGDDRTTVARPDL